MNQFKYKRPDLDRLMTKLKIKVEPRYTNLKRLGGPAERLDAMRQQVTALFKYERLELPVSFALEARGYAECLINEAMRHGDKHQPTMQMADYWLHDKRLIHKLFKVLVPRYQNCQTAYTNLFKAPLKYPAARKGRSLLELKGNPYPPMIFDGSRNRNLIHNILLEEARREYTKEKYAEVAKKVKLAEEEQKKVASAEPSGNISKATQEVTDGEELLKCSESYETKNNNEDEINTVPLV